MYQRKDNVIRFPQHAENLQHYNYCMYQNENYSNKWFYAFITNIAYVNDNCSFISIKTDTFQTWQFDLDYKQSFIEREMLSTNDDVPGANLVPESLETGEYKIGGTASFDDLEPVNIVAYSGEKIPQFPTGALEDTLAQGGFTVNGISSTVSFIITTDNTQFNILMNLLQKEAYSSYIVATFTVPKLAIKDFIDISNLYPRLNWWRLYFKKSTEIICKHQQVKHL
jgi:hypothetical protein